LRFESKFDQGLFGAYLYGRDAERTLFSGAWFGYPDAAYRGCFLARAQGRNKGCALAGRECPDAVDAGSSFSAVVLRDRADS
jgi:hypothetical protein